MENKKGNKSVTAKSKSRAKYHCPDELARLIALANSADQGRSGDSGLLTAAALIGNSLRAIARSIDQLVPSLPAGAGITITLDWNAAPEDWMKVSDFEIFQLCKGVTYDARRVRECAICGRIFWARQDNMVACSPRCGNTNRQRRLRERRDSYETARLKKAAQKP